MWLTSESGRVSPEEQTTATWEEAMEANAQLMRVIQEMRAEINKLEKENQALRMQLTSSHQRTAGPGGRSADNREGEVTDLGKRREALGLSLATPHGALPSDSTPAVQETQGKEHSPFLWAVPTFTSLS